MKYLIVIFLSLLICFFVNFLILHVLKKRIKKETMTFKTVLKDADINELREDERVEILKITNFFENHNFNHVEDFNYTTSTTNRTNFLRYLKNYDTSTILKIFCSYNPTKKNFNKSILLFNLNSKRQFIISWSSNCMSLNEQMPDFKTSFTSNTTNLEKFLNGHIKNIATENIDKSFTELSIQEIENLINEISKDYSLEQGMIVEHDGIYYHSKKSLHLVTLKYIKEIFKSKELLSLNLAFLIFSLSIFGSGHIFPKYCIIVAPLALVSLFLILAKS